MTDQPAPTASEMLRGSLRAGAALQPVAKAFQDLRQGDIVLSPQGVLETVIGEPRDTGGFWQVGISCTGSIGPLRMNNPEALVVTYRVAGFTQQLNL